MKKTLYIALFALGFLASCDDDVTPRYTVGEENNVIVLGAGIVDGGSGTGVQTRAGGDVYVPFSAQTQLRLRMDGTWTGHTPETVSKMTTAKTAESATEKIDGEVNDTHAVVFVDGEHLYWDDYGTADPANKETGRTTGLTIYSVAVEGKSALPNSTPADLTSNTLSWTELSWNVGTVSDSKISQKSGWGDYDLITSNNIRPTADGGDGNYTFANATINPRTHNLLKFTHAMTKITVNLTADVGFPGYDTGVEYAKFQEAPEVTLLGFYYSGKVNVEAKTSEAVGTGTNIEMWRDKGVTWATGGQHTSQFTALVFPGNTFADATDIIKLVVDGNTLNVKATKINAANNETNNTFEQGKNYIFNIIVKKTGVIVTATVKDWEDVSAEEEAPKINVTATYGYTTSDGVTGVSAFTKDYDLFRSTTKTTGYDEDNTADGINPAARYTSSAWNKTIYWPDHQTHYFFRGIYPQVGSSVSGTTALSTAEAVTTVNSNDVVAVANATYTTDTYPSDLAIAIPRKTDGALDEDCKESGHTSQAGICATEGVINMNFEYAMSKVEIRLKSSAEDASHLDLTNANTKVEIIGGYNKARIKLSDGLHDTYADADKGDYKLTSLTTPETGYLVTTLDAIVPQVIGEDVVFRITVTTDNNGTPDNPADDKIDVYECKVNLIKETTGNTPVAEWEHGKHYIYVLDVNKTALTVTATLKDWVVVTAVDQVWF